jgi:cytochrome c5
MISCESGGGSGLVVPTAESAREAEVSLEAAGEGYWVFQRKCLECHEARIPEAPLSPGWHATVDGMSWNAGLSKSEEAAILAYLQTAKQ